MSLQVGEPDIDHKTWDRPENIKQKRQGWKITKDKPGSDLAAETSAALSAISIAFRKSYPNGKNSLVALFRLNSTTV